MKKLIVMMLLAFASCAFTFCTTKPKVGDLQLGDKYEDIYTTLCILTNNDTSNVVKNMNSSITAHGNFRFYNTQWDFINCQFDKNGNLDGIILRKQLSSMYLGEVDFIRKQLEEQFGGGFSRSKDQIALYNNDGDGDYIGGIQLKQDDDICIVGVYKNKK